ncbi:hypothetical protein DPMN_088911 [Dreissena polymorpha]|uniref:Uncharacterized protein n=1 Tax=Dreissena polymorpha TaxID=45954 RepID=A0A9D4KUZ0_DREPO|nr:hypothetical protein DPMN_088911 [Dreissena polymorpha]
MARVVNEFEISQERIKQEQTKGPDIKHHEQVESEQNSFVKQVQAMANTLEEMSNPFLKECEDLVLGTGDIADPNVANTKIFNRFGRINARNIWGTDWTIEVNHFLIP